MHDWWHRINLSMPVSKGEPASGEFWRPLMTFANNKDPDENVGLHLRSKLFVIQIIYQQKKWVHYNQCFQSSCLLKKCTDHLIYSIDEYNKNLQPIQFWKPFFWTNILKFKYFFIGRCFRKRKKRIDKATSGSFLQYR